LFEDDEKRKKKRMDTEQRGIDFVSQKPQAREGTRLLVGKKEKMGEANRERGKKKKNTTTYDEQI